jgi:alginate O-acetyltransferase complex protein AlgI
MLFSSGTFLFAFLPTSLICFYFLASLNRDWGKSSLILISLVFYGWVNTHYIPLLLGSIIVNYYLGTLIQFNFSKNHTEKVALIRNLGVSLNLAVLIYFKYTNFFLENLNNAIGTQFHLLRIALPLGISFFTFQRIAYLVDCARGEIAQSSLKDFSIASLFFPQLISGPITLYGEIQPQLQRSNPAASASRNLTIGLVIFTIGLLKKVGIADNASYICDPIFDAANHEPISLWAGWVGVLAYTVQLYFDFSGYSDMAIGAARMFGIFLPLNFHSPLRAPSIIEYWRRWHITLNRFLVRYFYQPLSLQITRATMASRLSRRLTFFVSVVFPVFLTFVVLGIWHGAGWTFVVFGVLHATYVSTNEVWREFIRRRRRMVKKNKPGGVSYIGHPLGYLLTLVCVLVANAMFRSDSVATAITFYKGMFGLAHGAVGEVPGLYRPEALLVVVAGWFIIAVFPNTQQIMSGYRPAVNWQEWRNVASPVIAKFPRWRPNVLGLASAGVSLAVAISVTIFEMSREPAQFIYFQF